MTSSGTSTPSGLGALERLRGTHRRSITSLLSATGPMSRADLVRATGLSRTTVSSLVAELMSSGYVTETTDRGRPHTGGSGRPPLLLRLTTPAGGVAGVDIGHGHVRVVGAARAGTVLAEQVQAVDVDADGPDTLDRAAAMVRAAMDEAGLSAADLQAVGMCVPAPLNRRSARIDTASLAGWRGLPPAEELASRLGAPVFLDNDANLGALAELHHGAARGHTEAVYLKLASGVGAGLVIGGRLHRGATGIAGELGHVQVGEDGHVCRCGNRGCLETLVAAPRLLDVLRPAYGDDLTTERMLELDAADDAGVRRVLSDAGRTIGRALADLCNSLNPAVLVVGGSLGSSRSLGAGIRDSIDRYAQPDTAAAIKVVPGQLGDRGEVVGAVSLAISRLALA
jgi:predicted NBD/HSP70 family sugar kinase